MAHGVLPTRSFMRRFVAMRDVCPMCHLDSESVEHLFVFCSLIKPIWITVEGWLSNVAGRHICCDTATILFFKFSASVKQADISVLTAILCSELVSVIWSVRNKTVFEKKAYTTEEVKRLFLSRIRTRIDIDFHRNTRSSFEEIWARNAVLAIVSIDKIHINI
jgi:hypothetical protein